MNVSGYLSQAQRISEIYEQFGVFKTFLSTNAYYAVTDQIGDSD